MLIQRMCVKQAALIDGQTLFSTSNYGHKTSDPSHRTHSHFGGRLPRDRQHKNLLSLCSRHVQSIPSKCVTHRTAVVTLGQIQLQLSRCPLAAGRGQLFSVLLRSAFRATIHDQSRHFRPSADIHCFTTVLCTC